MVLGGTIYIYIYIYVCVCVCVCVRVCACVCLFDILVCFLASDDGLCVKNIDKRRRYIPLG